MPSPICSPLCFRLYKGKVGIYVLSNRLNKGMGKLRAPLGCGGECSLGPRAALTLVRRPPLPCWPKTQSSQPPGPKEPEGAKAHGLSPRIFLQDQALNMYDLVPKPETPTVCGV